MGFDFRERALLEIREEAVDELPDHEAEDRIAQELEPLVVRRANLTVFVTERLVGQGALEHRRVAEVVSDPALKFQNRFGGDPAHRLLVASCGAGGRSRTGTGLAALGILSPVRLPNSATPAF